MRLLIAAAAGSLLVSSLTGAEIERAMSLARARETERTPFHHRYIVDLPGPVVTQIEVITPFRRLVMIGEDHVIRGDSMFTRGVRAAEEAIRSTRGIITIRATLRFNPLNTFIEPPPYTLAVSAASRGALEPIGTQVMPTFSVPFKNRDGKTLSSLIGATLESSIDVGVVGQTVRTVAVTLDGMDAGHTVVDFSQLD